MCRRVGMADEADSKSVGGDVVWVQVPPPAPKQKGPANIFLFVGFLFARQHWGAGRARRGQRLCGLHLLRGRPSCPPSARVAGLAVVELI